MTNLDTNKYGLAFHTTTPQLGIAINNFIDNSGATADEVSSLDASAPRYRSQVWDLGRDVSSYLHQSLGTILQPQTWQDLEFIAVAKGPGGFTGTRIGVVVARTLGQQLNIPVFGISTLAAVALSSINRNKGIKEKNTTDLNRIQINSNSLLAVQMKARRDKLFVAIYQISTQDNSWQVYLTDTTMTLDEWQQTLANLEQPYQLIEAPENIADTVTSVLDLAYWQWRQGKFTNWQEILPFYGQHPV